VWGRLLGSYVFGPQDRRPGSHVLYGLTRWACMQGFLIIFLHPPTLEPRLAWPLFCAGLVLSGMAEIYSWLRPAQTT